MIVGSFNLFMTSVVWAAIPSRRGSYTVTKIVDFVGEKVVVLQLHVSPDIS